jgi:hypothetical protein
MDMTELDGAGSFLVAISSDLELAPDEAPASLSLLRSWLWPPADLVRVIATEATGVSAASTLRISTLDGVAVGTDGIGTVVVEEAGTGAGMCVAIENGVADSLLDLSAGVRETLVCADAAAADAGADTAAPFVFLSSTGSGRGVGRRLLSSALSWAALWSSGDATVGDETSGALLPAGVAATSAVALTALLSRDGPALGAVIGVPLLPGLAPLLAPALFTGTTLPPLAASALS